MNNPAKNSRIRAGASESSYGGSRMRHDGATRTAIIMTTLLLLAGCGTAVADSQLPTADQPNTNSVEYWCPGGGIKVESPGSTFTVPAPPEGKTWVLLVLKAGSEEGGSVEVENETFANPVVGQTYSRTDGKGISHAILCYGVVTTTTTAPPTTTTTLPATTTTLPATTTTAPNVTTTTAATTTTVPSGGTTTTTSPAGGNTTTTVLTVNTLPATTAPRPVAPPPVVVTSPPATAVPVTIPATE